MKSIKSQIFIFDMIFSIVIIIVSIGIAFSYYSNVSQNIDIYELNKNILTSFTTTPINSLNSEFVKDLFKQREVKNIDNSIAQQASEFYYRYTLEGGDNLEKSRNLTQSFIEDFISPEMNFQIVLDDGSSKTYLFNQSAKLNSVSEQDADIVSYSQRTVFGFLNRTNYYGPYILEVKLWV